MRTPNILHYIPQGFKEAWKDKTGFLRTFLPVILFLLMVLFLDENISFFTIALFILLTLICVIVNVYIYIVKNTKFRQDIVSDKEKTILSWVSTLLYFFTFAALLIFCDLFVRLE